MQHIRRTRNDVAHSRRLFTRDDVVILYKKVDRWVTPLGVDLMEKVEAYRRKRPKFLSELAPRARELRHVFEKSG
jgi:hypothetical protein